MIGNLLSDQPTVKRTSSMVPPGMGELNYLQSLIAGMINQEANTWSSPTFVGLTLTGLTASLPIVTNASKALASVSYAAFKSSLAIAQADVAGLTTASSPTFAGMTVTAGSGAGKVWTSDAGGAGSWASPAAPAAHVLDGALHTVSGETAGYFLKALSATTFGFAAHGLIYSDVGAEVAGAVSTHNSSASAHGFTTAGKALANLANPSAITFPRVNADNTATLLSASDFRTAIGAGTSSFDGAYSSLSGKPTLGTAAAQDVGYFDLSGVAAGAVSAHAALITGVHGLVFTAAKALTLQKSMTLTAADDTGVYTFPTGTSTLLATTGSPAAMVVASQATGDLLYASSATAWARAGIGAPGQVWTVNVGGTLPGWANAASGSHTLVDTNNTVSGRTAGQMLRATAATTYGWTTNTWPDTAAIGTILYASAANVISALAAGATTQILVGGGAAAPVWTAATGTDAPVRAGSPTFTGTVGAAAITTSGVLTISLADSGPGDNVYAASIINLETTAGRSYGLFLKGGSNSGDHALFIKDSSGNNLFRVSGLGVCAVLGGSTSNYWLLSALSMGYSGTDSWIQSGGASATASLLLNPSGGNVGIGTASPTSLLQVVGLPTYGSNALAKAAGLTVGACYIVTGAIYSGVCIVV